MNLTDGYWMLCSALSSARPARAARVSLFDLCVIHVDYRLDYMYLYIVYQCMYRYIYIYMHSKLQVYSRTMYDVLIQVRRAFP